MTLLIAYFLFILCVLLESILYLTPAYPACLPRQPGRLPFIHPARGFVPLFLDSVYTHDDCACDVTGTDITGGFTGDFGCLPRQRSQELSTLAAAFKLQQVRRVSYPTPW